MVTLGAHSSLQSAAIGIETLNMSPQLLIFLSLKSVRWSEIVDGAVHPPVSGDTRSDPRSQISGSIEILNDSNISKKEKS